MSSRVSAIHFSTQRHQPRNSEYLWNLSRIEYAVRDSTVRRANVEGKY